MFSNGEQEQKAQRDRKANERSLASAAGMASEGPLANGQKSEWANEKSAEAKHLADPQLSAAIDAKRARLLLAPAALLVGRRNLKPSYGDAWFPGS